MNKKNCRLIFFGNERLATGTGSRLPIFLGLIESGYDIAALILNQATIHTRNNRDPEIIPVANRYKIPVLKLDDTDDISAKLRQFDAQAGILAAFGRSIPQDLIDIFPSGIINIHPSFLPQYRGPTPVEQALLDGQGQTGVSIMRLEQKIDAGPIFAQAKVGIPALATKQELADSLGAIGSRLLTKSLSAILSGRLMPVSQNNELATYTRLIDKSSGLFHWSKPATELEREVRAYQGWPKSRAKVRGHEIIITRARVAKDTEDGDLVIGCNPGWLEILELTAPSGRIMSGADFLRGYTQNAAAF